MTVSVPHFAFPFRVGANAVVVVEEDSLEEIAQCVEVLVRTRPGDRLENLPLGVPDMTFSDDPGPDRIALVQAVQQWEPRANVLVTDAPDTLDELIRLVTVRVSEAGGTA